MELRYSASELLDMALDGLPKTVRGIQMKASRENWDFAEAPAKGGKGGVKKIYTPPPAILKQIQAQQAEKLLAETAPAPLPALPEQTDARQDALSGSTAAQRNQEGARLGVLQKIEEMMEETRVGKDAAITTFLTSARLPQNEQWLTMLMLATDKRGGGHDVPSICTIKRWFTQRDENRLMAKIRQPDHSMPPWGKLLLQFYRQHQKPSVQAAYDCFVPAWQAEQPLAAVPSIHAVRRFLQNKMGNVSRERGRMGKRELKNIQGYVVREFRHLDATEIYTADGHTFDAEILHPDGKNKLFRPEITTVADVATRRIVGWSVDLAESGGAVLAAVAMACGDNGICSILYVDNGKGYRNKMMTDAATGLMSRLGITMMHSLPYNSQARGVIERIHQTVWVPAAKTMQSYIGADMDKEAAQAFHKTSRKLIKQDVCLKNVPALAGIASLKTNLVPDFAEFVAFCKERVAAYNSRPHRSLPKVTDTSGKIRHMTPDEMWALKVAQGSQIVPVDKNESLYVFLPQKLCHVKRCQVRLHNNVYYSAALEEYHGEDLKVAYNIHDAMHVWLFDDVGRFICRADWNGNNRDYFPKPVRDQAKDKRIDGQLKRLAVKQSLIESARPVPVIEHQQSVNLGGTVLDLTAAELAAKGEAAMAKLAERVQPPQAAPQLSASLSATVRADVWCVPETAAERFAEYRRICGRTDLSEAAARWVRLYPNSSEYRAMCKQAA